MRYDWSVDEITELFELPFNDLMFRAQQAHRAHFDANEIQLSTLLSIKTGGCLKIANIARKAPAMRPALKKSC